MFLQINQNLKKCGGGPIFMTKLGYFDAKRNKPRSPNYKIEKFDIYKETQIFLVSKE